MVKLRGVFMEEKHIVIGIEGLVGAGKTSICRELLKKDEHAILLHGGNLYRAIVYMLMQKEPHLWKIRKLTKHADMKQYMDEMKVEFRIEDRESKIYIDGVLADEEQLQSKASSLAVSVVGGIANHEKLFDYARNVIHHLKQEHNVIVSGRALMEIYPKLDYHIFVTANLEERVKRKCIQYKEKKKIRAVKRNIQMRDLLQKMAGFYKISPNTQIVDVTECKSVQESTRKVCHVIKEYAVYGNIKE